MKFSKTLAKICVHLFERNGIIVKKKENKGRIQPLERVETDDCTSIDTSTLPLPPDEMLGTSENSDLPFQERFIA